MGPITLVAVGFCAGVAATIAAVVSFWIVESRSQERALYGRRDDRLGWGGTAWTGNSR